MIKTGDRILTTHVGSLQRPDDITASVHADAPDPAFGARLRHAVSDVVAQQLDTGLDIVGDGEFGKVDFVNYVAERLGGFAAIEPDTTKYDGGAEYRQFKEFYDAQRDARPDILEKYYANSLACIGPIRYEGQAELARDLTNLKEALEAAGADPDQAFVNAISAPDAAWTFENRHYENAEEYKVAMADALRDEYRGIIDAGFLVQVDDPGLCTSYDEQSLDEFRADVAGRIDLINYSLRDLPADRIRYHTCYGTNFGPRVHDLELRHVVDLIVQIDAGAYSFEGANPRHEHEWRVWEGRLPDDKILIPGVITQSSVVVEHPELVADRVVRYASVVGRDRVIAGADCGFAPVAGLPEMHPLIVWAKLGALVEGARIASEILWK
jgi:5-methyltetrahydropteroyltriglutamate--homocysteine methyltransferase